MSPEPTESTILSNFLLPPTPLPLALPLETFTNLFPRASRSSPEIPLLYRELQYQVALGVDEVKRNITGEVQRGEETRIRIARARRRAERNGTAELQTRIDAEVGICRESLV
jgi:centromere-localized protein 2